MTAAVLLLVACAVPEHRAPHFGTAGVCDPVKVVTPKEALRPFNVLVGSWKGSGKPEGTKEEQAAGIWEETVAWEWTFKDQDAWLTVTFTKGKHFTKGELSTTPLLFAWVQLL